MWAKPDALKRQVGTSTWVEIDILCKSADEVRDGILLFWNLSVDFERFYDIRFCEFHSKLTLNVTSN
jgi:hypothetical protein